MAKQVHLSTIIDVEDVVTYQLISDKLQVLANELKTLLGDKNEGVTFTFVQSTITTPFPSLNESL